MGERPMAAQDVVRASHHMFYLVDGETFPLVFPRPLNGLTAVLPGAVAIFVGASDGAVMVAVEARPTPPAECDDSAWDEVVELSMEAGVGRVTVVAPMDDPPDLPVLTIAGPGHYRVRVHARGRDTAPDLPATEPIEEYLVVVWPGAPAPETVYRQTDAYGAGLRRSAAAAPPVPSAPEPGPEWVGRGPGGQPAARTDPAAHRQRRLEEEALRQAAARARERRRPTD